jgi:predicted acylesterase/phospholipase RssA
VAESLQARNSGGVIGPDHSLDVVRTSALARASSSVGIGRADARDRDLQILALDGGGVKAIFTAHVLARLEADLGVAVADHFDLIAGTSAGGIIALALGSDLRPARIVDHYEALATDVFPAHRRRWYRWPARLWRTTYRQKPLRDVLHTVLGDRLLGESSKRLLIPSWDARMGAVHVFKTPHHPRLTRDHRIPMVDVALATSAAPTFLPAAHVDGHRLLDGGLWANNPSAVAIAEAVSMLGASLDRIRVLNVGTTDPLTDHPQSLDRAGYARWASRAVDLTLTASSRGTQGLAAHLVGPERYYRFDVVVPRGRYRLDRADASDLAGLAASASRTLSPVFTQHFAAHRAAPYPESAQMEITR